MLPLQRSTSLEDLDQLSANSANTYVQFTAIGEDWLEGRLALDARTKDAEGNFHPGAFGIFAETLGSVACSLSLDASRFVCVGQSIHLHHPAPVHEGPLRGRASCVSSDENNQVWNIEIKGSDGDTVCVAMLTMAIIARDSFTAPREIL